MHSDRLNALLAPIFSVATLFPGSLNLHADGNISLPEPTHAVPAGDSIAWEFVPIVLDHSSLGVVARRGDTGEHPFIEVFAPEELRLALGIAPGDWLIVHLLPGTMLRFPT